MNHIVCISPVVGSEVARRPVATASDIATALVAATTMSRLGFEALTRPKSDHLRLEH